METEVKKFDAEVGKILQLMIHSLYTNKDIFLRELISNSSDACDKLRYLSIHSLDLLKDDPTFRIRISSEKENRLVIVEDNGIGMDKNELIENLGTIAKSGTQAFMSQLTGDSKKDNMLIGQFGVGFYSVFMIAAYVKVISVKAGSNESYQWESDGLGEYKVTKIDSDLKRGTRVIISIKEGNDVFLDHFRIKNIIKNYSDHISIPIFYVDETTKHEVQVNSSSALWTRSKNEITEEQYREFYRSVSYSADNPWAILHNRNEGLVEFTNLLFIPEQKTFDLFHPDRRRRVKLYIKRVFITDEGVELVPRYLRFIRGVVDCEDLPLNISRETLQHNPTIDKIRAAIISKVLAELKKRKSEDGAKYEEFWHNFGAAIKEGLCESTGEHQKILEVCIFKSALTKKMITLDEYINNMQPDQKVIFFLTGENETQMRNSPQIEGLLSKNIDVLLLTDMVDDFWVTVNNEYKDLKIESVTRAETNVSTPASTDKESSECSDDTVICQYFKSVLGDLVEDVCISKKLTSSPVCLSAGNHGMDIRMERFLLEQKQLANASKKILEINPNHPIIQNIKSQHAIGQHSDSYIRLLFSQACILEGEPIHNPKEFTDMMNELMIKN